MLRKAAAALVGLSLVAAPVAASASPVASFDNVRADTEMSDELALVGGANWLVILLGLAAVVGAIVLIADDGDDSPTSP